MEIEICVIRDVTTVSFVETSGDRMVWQGDSEEFEVYSTEPLPDFLRKNYCCMTEAFHLVMPHEAEADDDEKEFARKYKGKSRAQETEIKLAAILNKYSNNDVVFIPYRGNVRITNKEDRRLNTVVLEKPCKSITFNPIPVSEIIISAMKADPRIIELDTIVLQEENKIKQYLVQQYNLQRQIDSLKYNISDCNRKIRSLSTGYHQAGITHIMTALKGYILSNKELVNEPLNLDPLWAYIKGAFISLRTGRNVNNSVPLLYPLNVALELNDYELLVYIISHGGFRFTEDLIFNNHNTGSHNEHLHSWSHLFFLLQSKMDEDIDLYLSLRDKLREQWKCVCKIKHVRWELEWPRGENSNVCLTNELFGCMKACRYDEIEKLKDIFPDEMSSIQLQSYYKYRIAVEKGEIVPK